MTSTRLLGAGLLFVLVFGVTGCGARSINDVIADPAKYRNQSVTVRGTVEQSATVLGRGAYQIADRGQSLWVVTTGGAPRQGARVKVTGRLQDGYDLGVFGNVIKLPGSLKSGLVLLEESHSAN